MGKFTITCELLEMAPRTRLIGKFGITCELLEMAPAARAAGAAVDYAAVVTELC